MTPELEITHTSDTHLYFTVMEGETDTPYRIAKKYIRMETSYNPYNDDDPTHEIDDVMDYYELEREGMYLEIKDIILDNKEHWKDDTLAFRMAEGNLIPCDEPLPEKKESLFETLGRIFKPNNSK